jgi:DNA polymerase elongation subunit (family B)
MIVNIEVRDAFNARSGQTEKQLVISYIDKKGEIQFLHGFIPKEQMFNWYYLKETDYRYDPDHISWDFRRVKKIPTDSYLCDTRVREIICDILKNNEELNVINELNTPDTAFCDIEVNVTDDGFPDPINVSNPVNTISWVHGTTVTVLGRAPLTGEQIQSIQSRINDHCSIFDEKYNFFYVYHENEYDLLMDFFENYMEPVSCVTGWNFFGYDYPYLFNRARKIGIDMIAVIMKRSLTSTMTYGPQNARSRDERITLPLHKLMYDYMEIYAKWDRSISPKESNKLDWVSEKALGVKKVVHELGFKALWEQRPDEYVFYNAVDSILVREIDKKLKTAQTFFTLANLLHVPALTAFSPVQSLQTVQTEYLYRENRIFPRVKKEMPADNDQSYTGAFVYEPVPGVYKNIIALDFASLYPSTIRQFNISPDTFRGKMDPNYQRKDDEIKTISGATYARNYDGFVPKILTDFYKQRKAFKKEMQIAEKEQGYLEEVLERRTKNAQQ